MSSNIAYNTPIYGTKQFNEMIDKVFQAGYETGKASAYNNGTPNDQLRMW